MDLLAFLKNHVPCYIYDGEQITRQCQKLKKELSSSGAKIFNCRKCNEWIYASSHSKFNS